VRRAEHALFFGEVAAGRVARPPFARIEQRVVRRGVQGALEGAPAAGFLPFPVAEKAGGDDDDHASQCDEQIGIHACSFASARGRNQGVSASRSASSMSTATMRETPCSCIVTPMSCSAAAIVILL